MNGPGHPSLVERAWRHGVWRAERLSTAVADRLRRGDRTIVMTPQVGPRLGNLLYLWLHAHQQSAAGQPTFVLSSPPGSRNPQSVAQRSTRSPISRGWRQ